MLHNFDNDYQQKSSAIDTPQSKNKFSSLELTEYDLFFL